MPTLPDKYAAVPVWSDLVFRFITNWWIRALSDKAIRSVSKQNSKWDRKTFITLKHCQMYEPLIK